MGYFGHDSPTGSTPIGRIKDAGYMGRNRRWLVGENLGWGWGSYATARSIVDAWMNSPPHRFNLLHPRFRQIGVAVVRGTPEDANESNGVTVSTEYGWRSKPRKKKHRRR